MASLVDDFDIFWAAYPRREAKLAALKAYTKARRLASAEDILAGVERYKLRMPEERQYRPLPASFLNAGRWMDEDDQPVTVVREYWADECQREHGGTCSRQWDHVYKMRESA
jgi:hypothetical protein